MEKKDKYIGQLLDGRYEILEIIGSGGMAVVYRALCHRLNRYVAVKILREDLAQDEEFLSYFQTESQAVAQLSHPNIVSVYDVSRPPSVEYIVMELVEGVTLKQYMKSKGVLSWQEALHFSIQIAKALSHAHEKGVIHRDIKPQNIMILRDGTVKVADFGIAHLESAHETAEGHTLGSVHYMAPELARGAKVDARCDVYSLGIVMYEMLTGRRPYEGENAENVALQHISGICTPPHELNADIPSELEAIVLCAMAADPEERYQSADALLADLEAFRNAHAVLLAGTAPESAVREGGLSEEDVFAKLKPIGAVGELSKENYSRRRRRARKVSTLAGFFCVLIFAVAVFVFLWNFWLRDIFSTAERVDLPDFVGENCESVVNDASLKKLYHFTVVYSIDPDTEAGIIVGQDPEAGRSLMKVSEGIDVKLTVSTGVMMTKVPDVANKDHREATLELQNAGFLVDEIIEPSDTVTADYVISTNPAAGDELPAGSTVYMTVSGGPSVKTVRMPNVVGFTESAARSKLENAGLIWGESSYVTSDYTAGTVFKQSIDAGTEVNEFTKVYIWVSTGPEQKDKDKDEDQEPAAQQQSLGMTDWTGAVA